MSSIPYLVGESSSDSEGGPPESENLRGFTRVAQDSDSDSENEKLEMVTEEAENIKKVCKLCEKKSGHQPGFQGHTTLTCPYRAPTLLVDYAFKRQQNDRIPYVKPSFIIPDNLSCEHLKYHSREILCLEFHPTKNNILLSADKIGHLGVWDLQNVSAKVVYETVNRDSINNMRFNPVYDGTVYASSSDGSISCTDIDTGVSLKIMDLNPENERNTNKGLYGMDVNPEKSLILVAGDFGFLYMVDTRAHEKIEAAHKIHSMQTRVVGIHCNPLQPDLFMSCGHDRFARLWDVRKLQPRGSIYELQHSSSVNSAYFSPWTGTKIITTTMRNRIHVWDSIHANLGVPSREIIHSHFNRHLTPFRAEWDPKDPFESLVVIGSCYKTKKCNGVEVDPIDLIDVSTGQVVAKVMNQKITGFSSVCKFHPRVDILATSCRSDLFIWKPKDKSDLPQKDE